MPTPEVADFYSAVDRQFAAMSHPVKEGEYPDQWKHDLQGQVATQRHHASKDNDEAMIADSVQGEPNRFIPASPPAIMTPTNMAGSAISALPPVFAASTPTAVIANR
jgi:hypothetical protein